MLRESLDWAVYLDVIRVAGASGAWLDVLFFVSVKRLVRFCVRRSWVSDPRAMADHRSAERRELCAWDDQCAGLGVIRIVCGWFLCVCLVF